MIQDCVQIQVNASTEAVFDQIDTMPNKFPIYGFMESGPIFFVRVMLVDGFSSAREAMKVDRDIDELRLEIGDSMGPFTLSRKKRPFSYYFELDSFFFNCRTGYHLDNLGLATEVYFILKAENPSFGEKMWWFFVKPIHRLFAKKVLKVIKERVEGA